VKYRLTKEAWASIGKQAGWIKEAGSNGWFEWDEGAGSGPWIISYRNIEPSELYDETGRAYSDREIMKNMIISIQNTFSDEKLSPNQIEYFIDKFMTEDEFFENVQEANQLSKDEQRIEQRDIDVGLVDDPFSPDASM